MIVGVNTDELVASYKSQPIIPFEERIALVKALKYPDIVIPQKSLDHADKVKKLNFDIFVVGDDWAGKYDYLEEHPELKTKKERKQIPWEELLYDDKETLGPRNFKSFFFPWRE